LFGAPITQLIKNALSKIFKQQVEERWALALSAVIACGLAVLEMFLNGQLVGVTITPETFPAFAGIVFSFAQIYYGLFKKILQLIVWFVKCFCKLVSNSNI